MHALSMATLLSPSQECHPFLPFSLAHDLVVSPAADAKGDGLQNPWSSFPGYTGAQVEFFDRAGEHAFMVKGSYDFSHLGLEGVTAYALWVHGWNAINPSTKTEVFQQDEYDVDLQWLPKSGGLKGLWFRVR